ncbi:transcription elongation factor GreB [Aestuariibacter sp. AA17]|uniref:Transcription elongation factor GreB n=1 Tax=Fluctibacter corallii TaxID=2984329 RepID=A0ABT3AAW8_9ALTE|nr:transcription elongation factor GreB [Aestuariibacter sp. AA17]MCV2885824.1 transcription elongation factor GreB [Aestuariibacter sp. AA17]
MKRSNYITRDGWEKLERELRFLWKEERPRVTQAVSEAAALGDRSENAEYIYGKKRLREIDRRVRFLSKRLEQLTVVYPSKEQEGKVFFGAQVTLEDDSGDEFTYHIVGPDEFDPKENKISIDSPMSRALIGKQVDDEVDVHTPTGHKHYFVSQICYKK